VTKYTREEIAKLKAGLREDSSKGGYGFPTYAIRTLIDDHDRLEAQFRDSITMKTHEICCDEHAMQKENARLSNMGFREHVVEWLDEIKDASENDKNFNLAGWLYEMREWVEHDA
jgi:hypothetical protein